MAFVHKSKKVVGNPAARVFGKRAAAGGGRKKKSKPRASNPGEILGFTLAGNPGRKAHKMAKTAKSHTHKKAGGKKKSHTHSGYKSNPGMRLARRRKHNPSGLGGVGPILTNGLFVIIGALGSKLGAQALLGPKNTGLMGYGGNLAVGAGLWFITDKMMHNKAASSGVIAGTAVQLLLRLLNDYTPFGQYLSQMGMGDYQMQAFATPQILVDPVNSAEIAPSDWGMNSGPSYVPAPVQRALPASMGAPAAGQAAGQSPSAAGMAGLYGGGSGGGLYG